MTNDTKGKHTPGPWKSNFEDAYKSDDHMAGAIAINAPHSGKFVLARVVVTVDGQPDGEGKANARLIAAAPDLLEALELCWQATGEAMVGDVSPEKLKAANRAARLAIAKAEAERDRLLGPMEKLALQWKSIPIRRRIHDQNIHRPSEFDAYVQERVNWAVLKESEWWTRVGVSGGHISDKGLKRLAANRAKVEKPTQPKEGK